MIATHFSWSSAYANTRLHVGDCLNACTFGLSADAINEFGHTFGVLSCLLPVHLQQFAIAYCSGNLSPRTLEARCDPQHVPASRGDVRLCSRTRVLSQASDAYRVNGDTVRRNDEKARHCFDDASTSDGGRVLARVLRYYSSITRWRR